MVSISLIDSGKGIPKDVIEKIGRKGFSFNKENGHGLGIYHAKKIAENAGGSLRILSREGTGTIVSFMLPISSPPPWFQGSLPQNPNLKYVIVDDDINVHAQWRSVLKEKVYKTFTEFKPELDSFIENPNIFFLIDNCLHSASSTTGLDFIRTRSICDRALLVTNAFESVKLQVACTESNVKLFPKVLISHFDKGEELESRVKSQNASL